MAEGNLQPGEKVTRTGTYKCLYCGPDGMGAQVLKLAMRNMGMPYSPPPSAMQQPPYRFFNAGDTFPGCPNCEKQPMGDTTGWGFVSEKEVKGPGGCFIATACYDSYHSPEVVILRRFRDERLLSSDLGTAIVQAYYKISPAIADYIRNKPLLKSIVKNLCIQPLVYLLRSGKKA